MEDFQRYLVETGVCRKKSTSPTIIRDLIAEINPFDGAAIAALAKSYVAK